jgi:hypothetical protein
VYLVGRARVRLSDGRRPLVAVKELKEEAGTGLVDEGSLMRSLDHPNILRCTEPVLTNEGKGMPHGPFCILNGPYKYRSSSRPS